MISRYGYILCACLVIFFVLSCKKEYSFEKQKLSHGILLKDIAGDCLSIDYSGSFVKEKILSDSNFIEVQVQVNSPGIYIIRTDTVNGYSFYSSGTFIDTGLVKVKMPGKGKPVANETDHFTIHYDSSSCIAAIKVSNNIIEPADYSLQGMPGVCMEATIIGAYAAGIALDTSSVVSVKVAVTKPGTYNISTNLVNGYSFAATGIFDSVGVQDVKLIPSGKPIQAATDEFIVTAGSSICSFAITVKILVPTINQDYFPLTPNSFWTYDDDIYTNDSLKRVVDGLVTIKTIDFVTMAERLPYSVPRPLYFRKTDNDYVEHCSPDKYTGSFSFSEPIEGDILFLRNILSKGDSWESLEFKGKASFGQVLTVKYSFYCTDNNAVVNINGNVFGNVYKIRMYPYIKSEFAGYGPTGEAYDYYYAKGVGLIYINKMNRGLSYNESKLTNWLVN